MREYYVVRVGRSIDQLLETLGGPFSTYQEAWKFGEALDHDRWTVVRRK